jgi:hypothetical protein
MSFSNNQWCDLKTWRLGRISIRDCNWSKEHEDWGSSILSPERPKLPGSSGRVHAKFPVVRFINVFLAYLPNQANINYLAR